MAIELERLIATLEANMKSYDKAMKKALGDTDSTFTRIEKRGKTLENRLSALGKNAFGGFAKGALAAVGGALTVTTAINSIKGALSDFDAIAKQAKAAGLDGEFFQELAYQAKLGGVEVSQLSQALNGFNRNAGMAVVGKGELVEKLRQLDPELLDAIRNAATQEQRIRLIADAISAETDASRKAALAAAAFGDAGVKMVEVLKGGSAQIDETVAKAKALGIVIDRDVLARAEELNDQFTTATTIIDTKMKEALVSAAPALVALVDLAARLVQLFGSIPQLLSMGDQSVKDQLDAFGNLPSAETVFPAAYIRSVQRLREDMERTMARYGTYAVGGSQAEAYQGFQTDKNGQIVLQKPPERPALSPLPGSKTKDPYADTITSLQREIELIGLDAREQEKLQRIREAGVDIGSAEADAIADLVDTKYDAVDATQAQIDAEQRLQEILGEVTSVATDAGKALIDALSDGKLEASELVDILGDVAKKLVDIGGNLLLGALTGGAAGISLRASGGPVRAGQPYIVGERGPELMVPGRSGTVVPSDVLQGAASASGAGATFSAQITIDASGAQIGAAAAIGAEVRQQLNAFARFELPRLHRRMIADPARANL